MPQKVLINFSDEQIAKLGNCKTAAEFQASIDGLITASGEPKTEQKVVLLADVEKIFGAQIKTFNDSVSAVATKADNAAAEVAKVNPAELLAKAEAAGSKAAAVALGKVGAQGASASNSNPTEDANDQATSAQLIAQGKFEEAWAADKKLQAEFMDAKVYAAYMKALPKSRILSRV